MGAGIGDGLQDLHPAAARPLGARLRVHPQQVDATHAFLLPGPRDSAAGPNSQIKLPIKRTTKTSSMLEVRP